MDEITEGLLEAYSVDINKLMGHLMDNKTIKDEIKHKFIQRVGAELFRIGYSLQEEVHPNVLQAHTIMLIPDELVDTAKTMMGKLTDDLNMQGFSESLSKAKGNKERAAVRKAFGRAVKEAMTSES